MRSANESVIDLRSRSRRRVLQVMAALSSAPMLSFRPDAAYCAETNQEKIRDEAIRLMRLSDLTPPWFTSANWGNGQYRPWTDYIVGRLSEAEFFNVCAQTSDYCLRDVWNLKKRTPDPIDWKNAPAL